MRLLYVTAGAAQMYCGSCLRDNALATELLARGHDVVLLPLYTPTLTDEPNVSQSKVFFGGISVYLEQHSALFRKTPRWLDRLWDSPLAIKIASSRGIATSPELLGELTVSVLKGEDGHQRKELDKMIDWLKTEPPFDLISLPNTLLASLAGPLKQALNLPIACTLQGEDLFIQNLPEPYRSESLRLIGEHARHVDLFVAVSDYYAGFMPGFLGIPAEQTRTVPLGINPQGFEPRPPQDESDTTRPFTTGFFARVAPEKGLHLLAEAYALLRERGQLTNARLEAAGYLAPEHKSYLDMIERDLRARGLGAEFNYRGAPERDAKIQFLRGLDVFSAPAAYDEPKGLSVIEALACGVPVVQPRRGGFTEVVERTGGGLLVEPDNAESLAAGLLRLAQDPALAADLGARGREGVMRHYTVASMADRALEVYGELLGR